MSPATPVDYAPDGLSTYAVPLAQTYKVPTLESRCGFSTNGPDCLIRQDRVIVLTPTKVRMQVTWVAFSDGAATLDHSVVDVVTLRAEPEMAGTNAQWHVTTVEHEHTGRDGADGKFPRPTMGTNRSRVYDRSAVSATLAASPNPAVIRYSYSLPERNGGLSHVHEYTP